MRRVVLAGRPSAPNARIRDKLSLRPQCCREAVGCVGHKVELKTFSVFEIFMFTFCSLLISAEAIYTSLLAVRYLGGILQLPSFWTQARTVFQWFVQKLFAQATRLLQDLGSDECDPPAHL